MEEVLVPIASMMFVFGTPIAIVFIVKYFRALEKGLVGPKARVGLPPATEKQLEALNHEKRLLEERIRNLESIVCSVDHELNTKLNRLAAQSVAALPQAAPALAVGAAGPAHAPTTPAMRPLSPAFVPGRILRGRYHIERELGRGGM